jgi:hypothetical protein
MVLSDRNKTLYLAHGEAKRVMLTVVNGYS